MGPFLGKIALSKPILRRAKLSGIFEIAFSLEALEKICVHLLNSHCSLQKHNSYTLLSDLLLQWNLLLPLN